MLWKTKNLLHKIHKNQIMFWNSPILFTICRCPKPTIGWLGPGFCIDIVDIPCDKLFTPGDIILIPIWNKMNTVLGAKILNQNVFAILNISAKIQIIFLTHYISLYNNNNKHFLWGSISFEIYIYIYILTKVQYKYVHAKQDH